MTEPIISRKTYILTYVGLLCLTLATTLLSYIDMGPFNTVVAVGIAVVKASLIAALFMHALYEDKLVKIILAGGVLWFLILITLTMTDYFTRYR